MFNVHSMSRAGMTITCGFVRLLVADLNPTLSCLKKKINESTVNINIIPVPIKENNIIKKKKIIQKTFSAKILLLSSFPTQPM